MQAFKVGSDEAALHKAQALPLTRIHTVAILGSEARDLDTDAPKAMTRAEPPAQEHRRRRMEHAGWVVTPPPPRS